MNKLMTSVLAVAAIGASATEQTSTAQRVEPTIVRSNDTPPTRGPAENFTGEVEVRSRFQHQIPSRVTGAAVTFQPGARTAWHTHPLGQTLVVTSGMGWVQVDGQPRREMRVGDVVLIPPGAKHWHGATSDSAMTHFAIAESLDGKVVTWMEKVSEQDYRQPAAGK